MKEDKEILIIDDDSKNIFALSAVLHAKKFRCVSAQSAAQGFMLLAENPKIAIVLMDMMMPEMDGYEAIGKMKNDPLLQALPVVAITAQAMTGDREKCLAAGADAYISKPVNVAELIAVINQLVH